MPTNTVAEAMLERVRLLTLTLLETASANAAAAEALRSQVGDMVKCVELAHLVGESKAYIVAARRLAELFADMRKELA